ncbi:MAG: hypothetical protein M0R77_19500 [Gammaproteobacteria bacterium]|nr:hypothetical protein [Gammaproteobacteria bacterium]
MRRKRKEPIFSRKAKRVMTLFFLPFYLYAVVFFVIAIITSKQASFLFALAGLWIFLMAFAKWSENRWTKTEAFILKIWLLSTGALGIYTGVTTTILFYGQRDFIKF